MRILAVCGSLQATSSNRTLLETAARSAPAGVTITPFEGLSALPHFNSDLEADGPLPAVDAWRRAIAESDALLIASPEYGHSLPGALKNAIDWVIGTGELERKLVAVTAAVAHPDRGRLGLGALLGTLGALSARVVGGEPIARGPGQDRAVAELVEALVERCRSEGAHV
jgi:NAD(P)H-dependent FMN reductase